MKKLNWFLLCIFFVLIPTSGAYCYQINIQPIQVAKDDGTYSHAIQIDEAQWDNIWAAAGIDIHFLEPRTINSTQFNIIDYSNTGSAEDSILLGSGSGYGQSTDPYVVNYWYVDDYLYNASTHIQTSGNSLNGVNGAFSSGFILNGNIVSGGNAPLVGSYFLARYVGLAPVLENRNIVANYQASLSYQIGPNFNADQIAYLQNECPYVVSNPVPEPVPEPTTVLLLASGLVGLAGVRKRLRKR